MGELGNIQRMSVTLKFGDKNGLKKFSGKAKRSARADKGMVWFLK